MPHHSGYTVSPAPEGCHALTCDAAGEAIGRRGDPEPLPLPQGFRDIEGQKHHPLHVSFAVLNPDGALGQVDGCPEEAAHFAPAAGIRTAKLLSARMVASCIAGA
jgi:hypothetical protein